MREKRGGRAGWAGMLASRTVPILAALAGLLFTSPDGMAGPSPDGRTKHIILFIGDGMHLEHERACSRYVYGGDRNLVWHSFPYRAPCTTWDVTTYDRYAWRYRMPQYNPRAVNPYVGYDPRQGGSGPYPSAGPAGDLYFLWKLPKYGMAGAPREPATDSASAATAISTGRKTDDGNICWLAGGPPDGALPHAAELLRAQKGFSTGIVSTVPFNHATAAAFSAHNADRRNYYTGYRGYAGTGIADEIVAVSRPDVVIGAGSPLRTNPGYDTAKGYLSKKLHDALRAETEYVFVERRTGVDGGAALADAAALARRQGRKLFGLFGGFTSTPAGAVYYSDFFENIVPRDAPGQPGYTRRTAENPLLKEATIAALEVLSRNRNGFFAMIEQGDIDWANHSNDFAWMTGSVWDLEMAVRAAIEFVNRPGDAVDWSNTLLIVTADHATGYMRLNPSVVLGAGDLPAQTQDAAGRAWTYPDASVFYATGNHTNEPVMVYATGRGSALFRRYERAWYRGVRLLDNTHLFHVMMEAAGVVRASPIVVKPAPPARQ